MKADTIEQTRSGLKNSIYDGIFATIFANLTGSMFLPTFALEIGASALHIGLLAAAPFFANLIQMLGAYFVERYNQRKAICIVFALLARSVWILIIAASLMLAARSMATLLALLIILVIVHHLFGALSGVAWLSWMAVLVPEDIRGRYFGLRNAILGAFNITFTLLAGFFLDVFPRAFPQLPEVRKFEYLFAFAVVCGVVSILFLMRKPRPPAHQHTIKLDLNSVYARPIMDSGFRALLVFASAWSLVVKLAAPFFIVYMIQVLHFDYGFIAVLTVCSAFADMAGMWIWGHFSDRAGNKPVVVICGFFIGLIPLFWLLTHPALYGLHALVILLHLVSGFFWAGFNLCSVNMVFGMAPPQRNTGYFAYWSAFTGVAAGIGAILGGMLANIGATAGAAPAPMEFKTIFLLSGALRLASLMLLKIVPDPKSMKTIRVVRILRNVKSWSGLMGFNPILHYFLPKKNRDTTTSPYWPLWQCRRMADRRGTAKPQPVP